MKIFEHCDIFIGILKCSRYNFVRIVNIGFSTGEYLQPNFMNVHFTGRVSRLEYVNRIEVSPLTHAMRAIYMNQVQSTHDDFFILPDEFRYCMHIDNVYFSDTNALIHTISFRIKKT